MFLTPDTSSLFLSTILRTNLLPFLLIDEPIPFLLAAIMGLQHAFAMVGGLITPPLVVFKVRSFLLLPNNFASLGFFHMSHHFLFYFIL